MQKLGHDRIPYVLPYVEYKLASRAHLLETKHINVGLYSEKHAARKVWYAVKIVKVAYLSVNSS